MTSDSLRRDSWRAVWRGHRTKQAMGLALEPAIAADGAAQGCRPSGGAEPQSTTRP